MARFILVHDAAGVLLAIKDSKFVYSKSIPEGMAYNAAMTFKDRDHLSTFFKGGSDPLLWPYFHALEVEPDLGDFASIGVCVKAGAPCWDFWTEGVC